MNTAVSIPILMRPNAIVDISQMHRYNKENSPKRRFDCEQGHEGQSE